MTEIQNPYYLFNLVIGDGLVRSSAANYRRYYHAAIGSASPGASGATRVIATDNERHGWLLDATAEYLEAHVDIHDDWDGVSSPVVEIGFTVRDDNSAGNATDDIKFQVIARYSGEGAPLRKQTVECSKVVGACAQYDSFSCSVELDPTEAGNTIQIGDSISLRISILDTGTLVQAVVNSISFYYSTKHIGIESTDV